MAMCLLLVHVFLFLLGTPSASSATFSLPFPDGDPPNPVADPTSIIQIGHVRFTILTHRLIRVERGVRRQATTTTENTNTDEDNLVLFEDRPTVAVVNRRLPVPSFRCTRDEDKGILTISTNALTLQYHMGQPFTRDSLQVEGIMYINNNHNNNNNNNNRMIANTKNWTYYYGDPSILEDNLLGTIRTLDFYDANTTLLNCSMASLGDHCEWGLISRGGVAIVNDTDNYILYNHHHDGWGGPNLNQEDFYLFGHGHDYQDALRDYRSIGGAIPLLPRYALGVWFSRWINLDSQDIQQVVGQYEQQTIPLDVFVLDMNWHTKHDWTGYSWDKNLFPSQERPLAYLKSRGLAVALNLHDAKGVNPWEDRYVAMCRAVGCNLTENKPIPFSVTNTTIAYALEDHVLRPLEEEDGVDFWWIDWQQGERGPGGAHGGKQNPTIWTAHVRSTNANRRGQSVRNMVLARWGGLGAHRYPVHFSGDVAHLSWSNLAYQPYFSMTATNVGALWSHDIQGPACDLELYTRWTQWGVLSGIMRSHDRGMSTGECANHEPDQCSIVEPWNVPTKYRNANLQALRLRGALVPYLYQASYQAHKHGRWFITPLYFFWPELDGAYETAKPRSRPDAKYELEYFLGDDLLVAPVVKPANGTDGLARLSLWVPPGLWVGWAGGRVLKGDPQQGSKYPITVDLNELPIFARAGAVIPTAPVRLGATTGIAKSPSKELIWVVALANGAPSAGMGTIYEDDGATNKYHTKKEYAITTAKYAVTSDETELGVRGSNTQTTRHLGALGNVTISFTVSMSGSFDSLPALRGTTIRLMNTVPPSFVTANGKAIPYARFGGKGSWSFDSQDTAVIIELAPIPVTDNIQVLVNTSGFFGQGLGFQLRRATAAKAILDESRSVPGSQEGQASSQAFLSRAASYGSMLNFLAADPPAFQNAVKSYEKIYNGAIDELQNLLQETLANSESFSRVVRALALLETATSRRAGV